MAYSGLQMFTDDLKKLIYGNHHPLINNNPMILYEKHKFYLFYQELASIIRTLSNIHQRLHHNPDELEKVTSLKKRLKDVADEAQDIIDLYLSAVTVDFTNNTLSPRFDVSETSLDLENVMRSIKSIKLEVMTINNNNMKMDSSPRIESLKTQSACDAAGTSTYSTRSRSGTRKPLEEIVVGLHRDVEIIRDKLTEDTKQLSIVSIVGMGGLGKTTLATKLFNDPFLKYHFHIRAWATVSQSYKRRNLLIQILTSIGVSQDLDEATDSKPREKLHKKLMGRRYLIVIDDIWSIEAWDELKLFFPHDNSGSSILLTTRLNKVALHMKPYGYVHSLSCLKEEESWELLKRKVFHSNESPEWLIEPGRQIAKKCQGLPLSVVVMAGVLAKKPMSKDLWEEIAVSVSSYIVSDEKGSLETLALSYHHLPEHLRECFLYLGGFPEDFGFAVKGLIWLWIAEGFIEEVENRSLEDTAEAYLMDLINRNLVTVARRNVTGDVKACKLHDLMRELCLQKAKEEALFLKIDSQTLSSQLLPDILYQQRRVFTNEDITRGYHRQSPTQTTRSLLCFHNNICQDEIIACSFVLLRVLDLRKCLLDDVPHGLALLIHLKYLAIAIPHSNEFPKAICKLWSLQTLILQTHTSSPMWLPLNIPELVNLRHLRSNSIFYLPYIEKPMNLHSISYVELEDGMDMFQNYFPSIKKLVLCVFDYKEYHFELLPYLETLKLIGYGSERNLISFPATLKKLTLADCYLPWSHMSIIQSLPNLEVLKLRGSAFIGEHWNACEQQFPQLKLLTLQSLDIRQWEASSTSFPCLKLLSLSDCEDLKEIPLEIGEISTLELIETDSTSNSVVESVKRIQQEQQDVGNYELKITVDETELSFYLSQLEDSESE